MNRRGLQRVQSLAESQAEDLLPQSYAGAGGGGAMGCLCILLFSSTERERHAARRSVCIAGFRVCVGVHGGPRACWWGGNPSFVSKEAEYTLGAVNEGNPKTVRADG